MSELIYPKMLYHYTSIDNLALILKNRTIRLNSLTNMDDKQEAKTKEGQLFGKSVFISSWTDDESESIPMWKMYTSPSAGVRIGLPPLPFVRHKTNNRALLYAFAPPVPNKDELCRTGDAFLDIEPLCNQNIYSFEAYTSSLLQQVEYVSDISTLEPQIVEETEHGYRYWFNRIGFHKNKHWEFQHEWRYRMCFIPQHYDLEKLEPAKVKASIAQRFSQGDYTMPFTHFDLDIAPEHFEKMVITPSPQMSPGNRVLLETLVEKYNPTAHIQTSELQDLL